MSQPHFPLTSLEPCESLRQVHLDLVRETSCHGVMGSHGACQILVKIEQQTGTVRYCLNVQPCLCVNLVGNFSNNIKESILKLSSSAECVHACVFVFAYRDVWPHTSRKKLAS